MAIDPIVSKSQPPATNPKPSVTGTRETIQVDQRVSLLKGIPLSLQHLFAMFGASVLVPILFNQAAGTTVIDPALVLMMNGIGTLIYTFVCRGKAPAFGQVSGAIRTIPVPFIGGVSMMLFGVIAASGLRMLIEAKVDYSKSRNLLLSAIILVVGISGVSIKLGQTQLRGMVLATIVGMLLSLFFFLLDKWGWTAEDSAVAVEG